MNDQRASHRRRAVDSACRVALVGYGYWGEKLGRAITACPGMMLTRVVDPVPARRVAAEEAFPGVTTRRSLRQVLYEPEVETVLLATPPEFHAEQTIEALCAGRHVFVEKPMALSTTEATAVLAEAGQAAVVTMVGHTFVYARPVRVLKQLIDEDHLGRLEVVESYRFGLGRSRPDCDVLATLGPHDLSILLFLTADFPVSVEAHGQPLAGKSGYSEIETRLVFASGLVGKIGLAAVATRKTRIVVVRGADATAHLDSTHRHHPLRLPNLRELPLGTAVRASAEVEPLHAEVAAFAEACATGKRPISDAAFGHDVVRLLDAVRCSADRGGERIVVE